MKLNTRRTRFVIATFIFIYATIGFLVDMYLVSSAYPHVDLSTTFYNLLTLQVFPISTFILIIIALLSIWITHKWHDRLMLSGTDYREITPETAQSVQEKQLYNVVEEMKISSSLKFMPKVYLINADYMNAFASGYSEKSAMVAITHGLISKLNRSELQAVMAHELSHIRHLDIKLTLMAAVLANITLIVIDLLFRNMLYGGNRTQNGNGKGKQSLFLIIILIRFLLPVITVILVLYLSRTREYMADAGCIELMRDNQPLASALLKIHNDHLDNARQYTHAYGNTPHESIRNQAYLYDPTEAGISVMQSMSDLFSSHPSIEKRLAAIGFKK
jgi:heat shock protein HtpX